MDTDEALKGLVGRVCGEVPAVEIGPRSVIGQRCRVFWPDDNDWYEAIVREYDAGSHQHCVWYFYDAEVRSNHRSTRPAGPHTAFVSHGLTVGFCEAPIGHPADLSGSLHACAALPASCAMPCLLAQAEWVDLEAEQRAGRVQWVGKGEPVAASAVQGGPAAVKQERARMGRRVREPGAGGTPGVSQGQPPDSRGPELMGKRLGIWWPEDACFYYGTVEEFLSGNAPFLPGGRHLFNVNHASVPSLAAFCRMRSFCLCMYVWGRAWPTHHPFFSPSAQPAMPSSACGCQSQQCWGHHLASAEPLVVASVGLEACGSAGQHRMQYEDGDSELLDLDQEVVDWRPVSEQPPASANRQPASSPTPAGEGAAGPSQGGDGPTTAARDVPASVPVLCNDKRGMFDVRGMCITMDGGRTVSATEFERLAGKAASKKWKSSIRVDKARPSLLIECCSPVAETPSCALSGGP